MRKISLLLFGCTSFIISFAQTLTVYPTNWWVGMKNPRLQLMIHANEDISMDKLSFRSSSADIKVIKVNRVENPHYLFIDVEIAKTAKPQKVKFSFGGIARSSWKTFDYDLKGRDKADGKTRIQGVDAKDFVYLLMPDRFANGDPSNDIIPGYRDQTNDRNNKFSRHGGDLKGIEDHLDYFNELGVTALWLTPVIENDMPLMSEWGNSVAGYHGYWFTDHYQVDKRFGGNEGYKTFCDAAHKKGLKVIQDAVYNHVGNHHWFVLDPPMKDWLNNWPAFQGPNHREEVFFDPHASEYDRKVMLDGWFVPHLPDLNQRNPYVANFLIQHAIWTTEEFGIDSWRVDTYKYCDEQFQNNINSALEKEFPKITVFGEASVNSVIGNAYFTRNNMNTPFKQNAWGVLDFEACHSMLAAMNEKFGWSNGANRLYMTMAQDVVYKDPMHNCIFLDNHDLDRVYSVVNEDMSKLMMGINWLFTLRGFPQLYYGTEVLMKNLKSNSDADIREDFPGGWAEDKEKDNRFLQKGRTDMQNEFFGYVSKLAHFRKNSSAICSGKMMQFIPKDGVYIYFRYDNNQTVMVITNTGENDIKPDWKIYSERTSGFTKAKNVVTGVTNPLEGFEIRKKESVVFELIK